MTFPSALKLYGFTRSRNCHRQIRKNTANCNVLERYITIIWELQIQAIIYIKIQDIHVDKKIVFGARPLPSSLLSFTCSSIGHVFASLLSLLSSPVMYGCIRLEIYNPMLVMGGLLQLQPKKYRNQGKHWHYSSSRCHSP